MTVESKEPSRIKTVRCLSCGEAYTKPTGGGTVQTNPGCPDCGYVGWVLGREPSPHGRTCTSPLLLGSPAAPVGVTTLTPPK